MRQSDIRDELIPNADPAEITEQFAGWVKRIADRYTNLLEESGAVDMEDLIQAGYIGLLDAQKKYDPNAGSSFLHYSFRWIRNAMLEQLGFRNKDRNRPQLPLVYLDKPLNDDTEDSLIDTIEDPDILPFDEPIIEDETRQETITQVRAAVDRLKSEKQREVIRRVYLDGQERSSVAADMGLKLSALYSLDRVGRSKLRRDYRLKQYAMPFFHVSVRQFNNTWTSAVEAAVIWREEHLKQKGCLPESEQADDFNR